MRRADSGFAMLFVLVMAGIVAITLYMALPRLAFENEREKEQTLIDRGEQYKRAVQLFVRQNKRWPAKIEDLENTNGKRYLRKRYVDPMTGKDEWRPVHVGPNGVLTDSLVKPLGKDQQSTYNNTFISELGGVGGAPDAAGATNPGLRKRPGEASNAPGTGDPTQPGASQPGLQANNNQPGNIAGPNGQPSPIGGPPGAANIGQPNQFTANPQGLQPNMPGGVAAGQLGANVPPGTQLPTGVYPGPPVNSQTGGISVIGGVGGAGYSSAPGANGPVPPPNQFGQQPQQAPNTSGNLNPGNPNASANSAAQLIQGILTTPRPGGAPGTPVGSSAGQVVGGGIAGFASKFEGEAIKIYNDQTQFQKWEFVYDMSKDTMITGAQQAIPQPPGPNSTNGFGNGNNVTANPAGQNPQNGVTPTSPGAAPVVR